MAVHVTHQFFLWVWSAIIILIILFDLRKVQALIEDQEETEVTLKNCCLNEINISSTESGLCSKTVSVRWSILKSYRIPRTAIIQSNDTTVVVYENVQNSLDCEDGSSTQFLISALEDQNVTVPKKGFFTFFSQDGHFQYDQNIYDVSEFCVDSISEDSISVFTCTSRTLQCSSPNLQNNATGDTAPTKSTPCLARCCNYGEVWDVSAGTLRCVDSGKHKWKPQIFSDLTSQNETSLISYREDDQGESKLPVHFSSHPRYLLQSTCKGKDRTFQTPFPQFQNNKKFGKARFKILKDGSVWLKLRKREWFQLRPGEYCVDGFQFGAGNYSGDSSHSLLFECAVFETQAVVQGRERQRKYSLVFGILLMFCLCFLLMTILVYILLWSKHNIHGWTVFSYVVALTVTFLSLGMSHFASLFLTRVKSSAGIWTVCGMIGIMCHFCFLSTFSWSTVLNYDLWCTFRNLRPSSRQSKGFKKFLAYCLFALIVPTSIVITGIFLDEFYSDDTYDIITPKYGQSVCYVEPRYARIYFVIVPIAVLLGINLLFFGSTAFSVYKVKKSVQFASSSSTKSKANNQTFGLILKLLIVNGTIWTVEILSWYLQTGYEEVGPFSFILDVVNALQAVAIFFLFVFKNDILDALKRSYPKLKGTVDAAYRLKNFGKIRRSGENTAASTDTSYNTKTNENMPVSKL